MFFKAAFALYLAAIALAAPKRDVIEVGGVGMFSVNPCPLCTSLSTAVGVNGNDIIKDVADNSDIL